MPDPAKHGLFKIKMGFITQHSVRMMFEPYGPFEVAEDHYRQQGYEPEFDMLPWQNDVQGNLAMADGIDPANGMVPRHADNDATAIESAAVSDGREQKTGWLEQGIARLAASRVTRRNAK